jgi:hypothetical protein
MTMPALSQRVRADEICCFVQRADAGPGDEFQIDSQAELLGAGRTAR